MKIFQRSESGATVQAWVLLGLVALLAAWQLPFFGAGHLPQSDDLAGHAELVRQLAAQLAAGNDPWFYCRWLLGGFPAFEFYGPLGHLLAALTALVLPPEPWVAATVAVQLWMIAAVALTVPAAWCLAGRIAAHCGVVADPRALAAAVGAAVVVFLVSGGDGQGAGLRYTLSSGVFSQVLAWPLLLLFVASAIRGIDRGMGRAAGWFLALLALHPLSAVVALGVVTVATLLLGNWRACMACLATSLSLGAVLWLPLALLSGRYGYGDPTWTEIGIGRHLADAWLDWRAGSGADAIRLALEVLLAGLAMAGVLTRERPARVIALVIVLVLVALLATGPLLASHLPLGLHYARVVAILALVLLVLFAVLAAGAIPRRGPVPAAVSGLLVLLAGSALIRGTPQWRSDAAFEQVPELLAALEQLPSDARVFFEYPVPEDRAWERFPGKLAEARLPSAIGLETANGLLTQSSRALQFPATAARRLGLDVFAPTGPTAWTSQRDAARIADLLRRSGVSHLVTADAASAVRVSALPDFAAARLAAPAPYRVFALADPRPAARRLERPVVGLLDETGHVPFRLADFWLEFSDLAGRVHLVELAEADLRAVPVHALLRITDEPPAPARWQQLGELPILRVPLATLPEPATRTPASRHNRRAFEAVTAAFEAAGVDEALGQLSLAAGEGLAPARLEWAPDQQSLVLTTEARGWYDLAYGYFPAWRSGEADVFQGSGGRITVYLPAPGRYVLTYRRWGLGAVQLGAVVSALALLAVGARIRARKPLD